MSALISAIHSFRPGQKVQTDFGTGEVWAISHVDYIVYVALAGGPAALYLFRPEQVEPLTS